MAEWRKAEDKSNTTGLHWENGCEVEDECLKCPLIDCRFSNPVYYRRWLKGKPESTWKREGLT